jgi:uncharacterized membrane protein
MRVLQHLFTPFWLLRLHYPPATLQKIEQRIVALEARHPGELRFVAEHALDLADLIAGVTPRERALEVFSQLRVWDTERNDGVLVYVLHAEHAVEIVADRGIARRVPQSEWDAICRRVEEHFRARRYEQGALAAIDAVAALLERYLPASKGDANELPDQPLLL